MSHTLNIGLDARFYGPSQTGLGRYTQRLIEHLEQIESPHTFFVFLKKENFDTYVPRNPNFKKILADYSWYSLEEQAYFPKLLSQYPLDLMHFFHFNVPLFYHGPYIVTIHDLILLNYPTRKASTLFPWQYALKYAAYKQVIKQAIVNAKHIIAVSEYTKQQILSYFHLPSHYVSVTYEASEMHKQTSFKEINHSLLKSRNIQPGYFLYVGNSYPHKNLITCIEAFQIYSQQGKCDKQLVLVGKNDYFSQKLQEEVKKKITPSIQKQIVFYGYASEEELSVLYQQALCYVFPSLEEGFGLPPLEAMSYQLPVICSHASCLPEIIKEAAIYINPYQIQDFLFAFEKITTSSQVRDMLIKKGRQTISAYAWESCAAQTLDIYQQIHAR